MEMSWTGVAIACEAKARMLRHRIVWNQDATTWSPYAVSRSSVWSRAARHLERYAELARQRSGSEWGPNHPAYGKPYYSEDLGMEGWR